MNFNLLTMKEYYIIIDASQKGPFSIDELKEQDVKSSTLVWKEEMENWTEAKNIQELTDIIKRSPPPIPKPLKKPLQVEARITNVKDNLIASDTKIIVAKETKY